MISYKLEDSCQDRIFIKIGRASDINSRLKQWNRQCGHVPTLLTMPLFSSHVQAAERLIHLNFFDFQVDKKCSCGAEIASFNENGAEKSKVIHREWFCFPKTTANPRVFGDKHALKTIEYWVNFTNIFV